MGTCNSSEIPTGEKLAQTIERIRDLTRIAPQLLLGFIQQTGQFRALSLIPNNLLPCRVTSQLWEELREVLKKLIALGFLQRADGFFDLLGCAHASNLGFTISVRNAISVNRQLQV